MDMSEALRMLAADRGMTIDALLQVLVEALATAYKKRPGAADEVIVGVNPDNMDITFTAYDVNDDGEWINERDDTPKKDELGRIAAVTFRQVMSQRIREVERAQVRRVREPRRRHCFRNRAKDRHPLHVARSWSSRSVVATSRASARRDTRAECSS